jgi:hypothetical protein
VTLTSSTASAYLWTTGSSSNAITVTTAGSYRVTVTGSNGCKATSAAKTVTSSTCTPPAVPTISSSSTTNILLNGYSITLTSSDVTGGWLWSNGATTRSITVTTGGTYTVKSFNGGNCYSTSLPKTIYLIYSTRLAGNEETDANATDLVSFPNPSNGPFTVSFNCASDQQCMINLYDLSGRMVMEKNISATEGKNVIDMNSSSLTAGMYLLRLEGENLHEQLRLSIGQ